MRRSRVFSGVLAGVAVIAVVTAPASAADDFPVRSPEEDGSTVRACRNRFTFNGLAVSAPEVLVRLERKGGGSGPPAGRGNGSCGPDPADGNDVQPRLIVSGAGLDMDASIAPNWL